MMAVDDAETQPPAAVPDAARAGDGSRDDEDAPAEAIQPIATDLNLSTQLEKFYLQRADRCT